MPKEGGDYEIYHKNRLISTGYIRELTSEDKVPEIYSQRRYAKYNQTRSIYDVSFRKLNQFHTIVHFDSIVGFNLTSNRIIIYKYLLKNIFEYSHSLLL